MKKQIVNFKIKILAKEKGFVNYKYFLFSIIRVSKNPTTNSLKAWLSKMHKIQVDIEPLNKNEKFYNKLLKWKVSIFKEENLLESFIAEGYLNSIQMGIYKSLKLIK